MAESGGVYNEFQAPIRGIAPGAVLPVRNLPKVFTGDIEGKPPPPYFTEFALSRLLRVADKLAAYIPDLTRYVEESAGESYEGPTGETLLIATADFSPASEMITEILVTGPVTTAFTLSLGSNNMVLSTDATGKCLLSPVSFKLGPNDKRQLSSVTSGSWFLHLSGHALTSRRT